jgi:hypothetical protein
MFIDRLANLPDQRFVATPRVAHIGQDYDIMNTNQRSKAPVPNNRLNVWMNLRRPLGIPSCKRKGVWLAVHKQDARPHQNSGYSCQPEPAPKVENARTTEYR